MKQLIEECNYKPEAEKANAALLRASEFGRSSIVKYLVEECDCNTEEKNNKGKTALYLASKAGHLNVVQYLVETCKCDVDAPAKDGRTPLHGACERGRLDIVKYLVEEGHATITPGIVRITRNNQEIKDYLLEQQQESSRKK